MRVIILGVGQVGYNIARYMATDENEVTVVDHSHELLSKLADAMDIRPVLGSASHPDVLQKAGAEGADMIIAVTASDEINIVACEVAYALFEVPTKIARIRNQSYLNPLWSGLFAPENISIDVTISPEIEVAKAIARSVEIAGAFDVISLSENDLKIIGVRCNKKSPFLNTPLKLLPGLFPAVNLMVVMIVRNGTAFIPSGDEHAIIDDELYFICRNEHVTKIMELFGFMANDDRRLLIIGGGTIGHNLAKELENQRSDINTMIIEKDKNRAEYAASYLSYTQVLNGDALDYEMLREAGIDGVETVISVTDDDKVNILSSLLAKRQGANRTLTLLNNMSYSSLITSIGVDAVISPRSITVSTILRHIREGRVRSVYSLCDGAAELIEAEARETSSIIGLTIGDINIKGSIKVMALIRDDEVILNPPKMVIHVEDRLVLVASKNAVEKVQKLFSVRAVFL